MYHRLNPGVRLLSAALAVAGLTGASAHAMGSFGDPALPQAATVTIQVLDSATALPLVNAEVSDMASGQHRFTDHRGQARINWPGDGRLQIRVRQIGFRLALRQLSRSAVSASDTANVAVFSLLRVTYVLPAVVARNTTRCAAQGDPASKLLAAQILEQLRASAERYEGFRKSYPFIVKATKRTAIVGPDGKVKQLTERSDDVGSDKWGDPYVPGRVVERTPFGFSVPILFLSSLADPVFWNRHCFAASGVESQNGRRVILLEFSPGLSVRTADWEGVAYVDSANSLLTRIEFRLAGLRRDDRPSRLEGYTTFKSASPNIMLPDSTVAGWWRREIANGEWGMPDVVQSVHVKSVTYRKAMPPQNSDSTRLGHD